MRKRLLAVIAAGTILAGLTSTMLFRRRAESGGLIVSPRVIDFGMLDRHQKATRNVTIRNSGRRNLRILRVRTDCACTVGHPTKNFLCPGEDATVAITVDSSGMSHRFVKNLYVLSDDRSMPLLAVTLRGYVRVGVAVVEQRLHLGSARSGDVLTGRCGLIRDMGSAVSVRDFTGQTAGLSVACGRWAGRDELDQATIEIATEPIAKKPGTYVHRLQVNTTDGQEFPLEVVYDVLPTVQYDPVPVRVTFGTTGKIALRWPDGQHIEVQRITSVNGRCQAKVVHIDSGRAWLQVVAAPTDVRQARMFDVLTVQYRLDHKDWDERLAIPVVLTETSGDPSQ